MTSRLIGCARALALPLLIALALLACGPAVQPAAAQSACPPLPRGLVPKTANPATRFTMLIRINQMENVESYTTPNAEGGLANHIRPQDIFVINTRFQNPTFTSSPGVAADLARQLRAAFPCNRIIALNGLGADPDSPGFVYALAGEGLWALMLDWERDDWNIARFFNPGMPSWTYRFRSNQRRARGWLQGLRGTLAVASPSTRSGLVPLGHLDWNYGALAQTVDRSNRVLGARHLGPQSVQTQETCMFGPPAFGRQVRRIRTTYRFKFVKRKRLRKGKLRKVRVRKKLSRRGRPDLANLAVQVSFSDTPSPGDPLPVRNVAAITADRCVAAGLARGAGAFFLFASDTSMRLLFSQPTVGSLRPPL